MNAFGLHAMVLVSEWNEQTAETAISSAAAIGYDLIEVPLSDPASTNLEHTRDWLQQHRLKASVSLGLTPETDISSADVSIARAGIDQLVKVVDATAFIGGNTVAGVIASAWQKYQVPPTDAGYANAVSGIREAAQAARAKGVTLAVEVVNRFESNLLNTAAQAIRFVDAVGEDNVGIHLDSFHMHIEEADAAAAIRTCGARLRYFHVNENHRGYVGTGSIDFAPMFRALVAIGYAGPISFEAFSSSCCNPFIAGKAAIWRSLFEDGEDVARLALEYLQSSMASARRAMVQARSG